MRIKSWLTSLLPTRTPVRTIRKQISPLGRILDELEARIVPTAGVLDTSFGNAGKTIIGLGTGPATGNAVAIQLDGKIVLAGTVKASHDQFVLARYKTDGNADNTFGTSGFVITPFADDAEAEAIVIQADGKILVAGTTLTGSPVNDVIAIARYTSTGALDTTFGTGGMVTTPIGSPIAAANAITLQPDGNILVAGYTNGVASRYDFAVARYTTSGSLDSTFGAGGIVTTSVGASDDVANSVRVQSDGKIVVAGSTFNGSNNDIAVVRYTNTGALDNTFGFFGKVTTDLASSNDYAFGTALQADGGIVVAGKSGKAFSVVRYASDGSLDSTFGTGGEVVTPIGTDDSAASVAVQSNGRIVVTGYATTPSGVAVALVRYKVSGGLDTSFGTGGITTTSIGGASAFGTGVAIQTDGKIVVGGYDTNGVGSNLLVARYDSVTVTTPTATLTKAPPAIDATKATKNTTTVEILFSDAGSGMDGATFANSNITVSNGATITKAFAFFSADGDYDAIYTITSPAANWAASPQGTYTIAVTSGVGGFKNFDGVSVAANPSIATFFVDTNPPDTIITGNPGPLTNKSAAGFVFSGPDGGGSGTVGYEVSIDGGEFGSVSNPYTTPSLADGSHTVQIRAVDAAGNVDPTPASFTYVVDATPPDTVITGSPGAVTDDNTPSFTFSGPDGAGSGTVGYEVQIDGGPWTSTLSPYTAAALSDGNHTLQVRAIDAAGNVDPTPDSFSFKVDTVAPDTTGPVVLIGPPSAASAVLGDTITYQITYDDPSFNASTLAASDIILNTTGTVIATVSVDSGTGPTRTVTLSNILGIGTLGISLGAGTANDTFGNQSLEAGPSDTFSVLAIVDGGGGTGPSGDTTKPTVTISPPSAVTTTQGPITYTITYADANFNGSTLLASQVMLNRTGTAFGTVTVSPGSGATRTVTISNISGVGTLGISLVPGTANDRFGNQAPAAGPGATFQVTEAPLPPPPAVTTFAVGNVGGTVQILNSQTGVAVATVRPLDVGATQYKGLVEVAMGDLNGDGVADLVVAAADSGGVNGLSADKAGKVFVYDGAGATKGILSLVRAFTPFASHSGPNGNTGAYTNGLNIAVGDVDGDGHADLIAGTRGGNGTTAGQIEFGRLAVIDGTSPADTNVVIGGIQSPFGSGYQKGVIVAVGNVDGTDGDEIAVTRGGPVASTNPAVQTIKVKVLQLHGTSLTELSLAADGSKAFAPFAGLTGPASGIKRDGRVTFVDADGDGKEELVFSALDPLTNPTNEQVRVGVYSIDPSASKGAATIQSTGPDAGTYLTGNAVTDHAIVSVAAAGGGKNLGLLTESAASGMVYLAPLTGAVQAGGFSLNVLTGGITIDGI